jgi:putative cell wall-binding protein
MEYGLGDYTIKRLGGNTRYDTNLLILQEAGVSGKDLIVCTGKDFADSLSASAVGLPILLVKDKLSAKQMSFLTGFTGKIYIVGGDKAVGTKAEAQLKDYGEVIRLAGTTRYNTSVLVAKTFFSTPSAAVVAYGKNFPDGLSGGPVAYALGAPLLLTESGKEKTAAAYISESGIQAGYILGGTTVLPEKTTNKVFSAS